MLPRPRAAETRAAETTAANPLQPYRGFEAPWRFGSLRADGLTSEVPAVQPGTEATYRAIFAPQPPGGNEDDDHIQRMRAATDLYQFAESVVTYRTEQGDAFYRNQGPSDFDPLVRIEPIAASASATEETVPGRDSVYEGRWAVVTGGTRVGTLPQQTGVAVELQTVTLASMDTYATKTAVRAATERSGL
jgi:hypothetical protein